MNKKIFLAVLLCLLAVLVISCGGPKTPETCKHNRISDKLFEPDCSLEGYVLHTCLDCGYSYKSDFTAPAGHKITSTVVAPTCTEEGYTDYTCGVCGYTYQASHTPPTGHTMTSQIVPQTCTELGYTQYTCDCGYTYRTSFVIPNGHNLTATTVAPTCTANGYDLYKCNNCDYQYKTAFVPMTHTLVEQTIAPTCTEQGYTQKTCSACSYTIKSDFVAPTGHTFAKSTVAPSFNITGYTVFTCACGYNYKGDYKWYTDIFSGVDGNKSTTFALGVDLSYHNENVNFKNLSIDDKNSSLDGEEIDFVILRLGYDDTKDSKFDEYYAAARAAGLDIGCYIYCYETDVDSMIANTKKLLKHLEGKTFEYPIFLDIEEDSQKVLSKKTLMEMCSAYCELLVKENYFPGIYSYLSFITTNLNTEQLAAQYDVWVAHYLSLPGTDYYIDEYNMWQYTKEGTVNGVNGKVDIDICYKDYPSIIKKYGFNGYGD